ncbi:MAG: UDP-N-acetylmuramoyl-tripeptide--D-alanyl-D-alanine ligase [Candidatus Gottesmanbacteria bacterium]
MQVISWKQPFHEIRRLFAKNWLGFFPNIKIIAVTGSYGKTNTTRAIGQVLSQKYTTLETDINLDSLYNIPITILKVRPKHQLLILECGVDHRGEMDKHLSLFKPQIAVLTGISPVHSDPELLGSLEGIISEKSKLINALPSDGRAILNFDDNLVRKIGESTKVNILWYGTDPTCDFWADQIKTNLSGTSFILHTKHFLSHDVPIHIGLLGKHTVHEALAAIAIGIINDLSIDQIKKGLEELTPLPGRLSITNGPLDTTILDDHLRANPASTRAGLETLVVLPCQGRKIAVVGEMGELGQYAQEEHAKLGEFMAKLSLDYMVNIGPLQKYTYERAINRGFDKKRIFWAKDVNDAAQILKKILKPGDLWYLKGSLLRHLERIIFLLENKRVDCQLISCHVYKQCSVCPMLVKRV